MTLGEDVRECAGDGFVAFGAHRGPGSLCRLALTFHVPTGTVWNMATKEKRPRIDPELAAIVDQVRGRVPFEGFIEEAVGTYLHLFWEERLRKTWHPGDDVTKKWKLRESNDAEILINLLGTDFFCFDGKRFQAAVDETMAHWNERMDEYARDAEMEDDD